MKRLQQQTLNTLYTWLFIKINWFKDCSWIMNWVRDNYIKNRTYLMKWLEFTTCHRIRWTRKVHAIPRHVNTENKNNPHLHSRYKYRERHSFPGTWLSKSTSNLKVRWQTDNIWRRRSLLHPGMPFYDTKYYLLDPLLHSWTRLSCDALWKTWQLGFI